MKKNFLNNYPHIVSLFSSPFFKEYALFKETGVDLPIERLKIKNKKKKSIWNHSSNRCQFSPQPIHSPLSFLFFFTFPYAQFLKFFFFICQFITFMKVTAMFLSHYHTTLLLFYLTHLGSQLPHFFFHFYKNARS